MNPLHLFLALALLFCVNEALASITYPPVVLVHGITGKASDLYFLRSYLHKNLPGVYVKDVDLGGDINSIFRSINDQIDRLCEELAKDEILQSFAGINLIGFSQGGMIARGFLERCNDPPVLNFISWVSPQGGQFGVPGFINTTIERIIDDLVECCAYDRWLQEILSVAGYWRDPYQEAAFINGSIFLADVDNLRTKKNHLYKQRILNLKNFVMGYSLVDDVLRPKETGWFAHFSKNTEDRITWLEDQQMYKEDWIGLNALNSSGRLHRFTTLCGHGDYESQHCFVPTFTKNVLPFLQIPIQDQI